MTMLHLLCSCVDKFVLNRRSPNLVIVIPWADIMNSFLDSLRDSGVRRAVSAC